MKIEIQINPKQKLEDLKLVRDYFLTHDKTAFQHMAYSVFDKLYNKLHGHNKEVSCDYCHHYNRNTNEMP